MPIGNGITAVENGFKPSPTGIEAHDGFPSQNVSVPVEDRLRLKAQAKKRSLLEAGWFARVELDRGRGGSFWQRAC
jgi:hypothetical protein